MDAIGDLGLLELRCVDIHHQQVAGLELVQVIELDNPFQVGFEDLARRFLGDIDEEREVKAQIVSVQ